MIDLLVVNYNTKDLLKRLLDTLHSDYGHDVWKIYVADNDSTDGSKEWLTDNSSNYQIEEIHFNSNIGYSAAINKLAKASSSDILCAVNADTWFTTNHVRQVQASFDTTPEMAICGVKQLDESDRIRHGGIFWDGRTNPQHRGWGHRDPDDLMLKDKVKCWTVSGSIYYIRRSVWNELLSCSVFSDLFPEAEGAFLPTPHFFEETYCSVHAQHHGYEVWYDGEVETAGHSWHASSEVGDASRRYFDISKSIYVHACNVEGINHECK
jgi:glycosyltransferase involved in cell wall biosynthesis